MEQEHCTEYIIPAGLHTVRMPVIDIGFTGYQVPDPGSLVAHPATQRTALQRYTKLGRRNPTPIPKVYYYGFRFPRCHFWMDGAWGTGPDARVSLDPGDNGIDEFQLACLPRGRSIGREAVLLELK